MDLNLRFFAKSCIFTLSFAALVSGLTGCASVEELRAQREAYNPNESFAKNIGNQLGLSLVKDIDISAGSQDMNASIPESASLGFVKDTTMNVLVNKTPWLPSSSFSERNFGALFVLGLSSAFSRVAAKDDHNWILYYLPDNGRMTAEQAAEAQAEELNLAITKFLNDRKDDFKIIEIEKVQKFDGAKMYGFLARFSSKFCAEKIYGEDRPCILFFNVRYREKDLHQTKVPHWIDPSEPSAWKNQNVGITFFKENPMKSVKSPNEYLFYQAFSPYLPNNVFLYAAFNSTSDGNNPPMIFDNKKVYFFVKPKK
jgi:hypothetical protein